MGDDAVGDRHVGGRRGAPVPSTTVPPRMTSSCVVMVPPDWCGASVRPASSQRPDAPSGPTVRDAGPVTESAYVDRGVACERLDLGSGAWVDVGRGWLTKADELFAHLRAEVPWRTTQLFRYDHHVEERRLSAGWRPGLPLPHPALAEATRGSSTAIAPGSTASA